MKVLLYVAAMCGNPLLVGNDTKQLAEADAAADEAVRVAELLGDSELRCIAAARRAETRWPRLNDTEKRETLRALDALQSELQPRGEELERVRSELAKQFDKMGRCAQCEKADAEKRCGKCKLIRYCSAECQKAHYAKHKPLCDRFVEARAKMERQERDKTDGADKSHREMLQAFAKLTMANESAQVNEAALKAGLASKSVVINDVADLADAVQTHAASNDADRADEAPADRADESSAGADTKRDENTDALRTRSDAEAELDEPD